MADWWSFRLQFLAPLTEQNKVDLAVFGKWLKEQDYNAPELKPEGVCTDWRSPSVWAAGKPVDPFSFAKWVAKELGDRGLVARVSCELETDGDQNPAPCWYHTRLQVPKSTNAWLQELSRAWSALDASEKRRVPESLRSLLENFPSE